MRHSGFNDSWMDVVFWLVAILCLCLLSLLTSCSSPHPVNPQNPVILSKIPVPTPPAPRPQLSAARKRPTPGPPITNVTFAVSCEVIPQTPMDYFIFWRCRTNLSGPDFTLRTVYPAHTNRATLTVPNTYPLFLVDQVTNGFVMQ